jgi:BMFP domain-containing protein YqiC
MVITSAQFQDAIDQINAKFEELENKIKELEAKNEAKRPAQTRKTKQEAA